MNNESFLLIQGLAKRRSPGLLNYVTVIAYHFCLTLSAPFTQPGTNLLAKPCRASCGSRGDIVLCPMVFLARENVKDKRCTQVGALHTSTSPLAITSLFMPSFLSSYYLWLLFTFPQMMEIYSFAMKENHFKSFSLSLHTFPFNSKRKIQTICQVLYSTVSNWKESWILNRYYRGAHNLVCKTYLRRTQAGPGRTV